MNRIGIEVSRMQRLSWLAGHELLMPLQAFSPQVTSVCKRENVAVTHCSFLS